MQASKEQSYPSLQGMVHQASAAGILGALSCSLSADEPYRMHTQLQESGLTPGDKDALRSFLLEVCTLPSDHSAPTFEDYCMLQAYSSFWNSNVDMSSNSQASSASERFEGSQSQSQGQRS